MSANTNDMSRGKPLKLLLLFTLPMLVSVTFQQLYNIADSVIAGKFLGNDALAAVSASYPITVIFTNIGTGLGVGCSIVCSRAYGEKNYIKLKSAVSTSFISFFIIAAGLTVAGWFTTEPLLRLLSTPESIMSEAAGYLKFYVLGMVFAFLYNSCMSAFQALGNSRIPLYFLIFSTVFNVIVDILFVTVCGMSAWGLSLATVIAQGVACVGSMIVLARILHETGSGTSGDEEAEESPAPAPKRNPFVNIAVGVRVIISFFFEKKPYKKLDGGALKEIMYIGVPTVVQQSAVSIGQLFIQNLVNSYGNTVIAGYGAGIKINTFCISILFTTSNALSIFVSQNIGAGKPDRVITGTRAATIMVAVTCAVLMALCLPLSGFLISLFAEAGEGSDAVIAVGRQMLVSIVPFYAVLSVKSVTDSVLKGASKMLGFILGTSVDLLLRVSCAYLFTWLLDSPSGIWWSWAPGWLIGTAISLAFYLVYRSRLVRSLRASSPDPELVDEITGD